MSQKFEGHPAVGVPLTIVLAPVVLVAYGLTAVAILGVLTGWSPSFLSGETPIDFLYGGGSATLVRFFAAMGGFMVGSAAVGGITWGFTGRFQLPGAGG